jgi:hypothetical protein
VFQCERVFRLTYNTNLVHLLVVYCSVKFQNARCNNKDKHLFKLYSKTFNYKNYPFLVYFYLCVVKFPINCAPVFLLPSSLY